MTMEVNVPTLGESVSEATVAKWLKNAGDSVTVDEPICELETDKVTVEVPAPSSGIIAEIVAAEGADVAVGSVLCVISEGEAAPAPTAERAVPAPTKAPPAQPAPSPKSDRPSPAPAASGASLPLSPAVRKLVTENGLNPSQIAASGKDGRLTKGDVLAYVEKHGAGTPSPATNSGVVQFPTAVPVATPSSDRAPDPREERVKMTRLRKMVATRLKAAQNTAAMLTTFNEIDMTAINELRARYRDAFEKRHGAKLGVMSLFVKACVVALKEFPAVNAEIDGDDLVYKNHYDVAIAVGSPQGLVVPVLRDCDQISMAEIEADIADFGKRARTGQLKMEEMQGGTFTITNGGVFGSLMSTPILNPPQSGILGMHKVQQRPMVMADGAIQARPMMYVALSYDHRIIDGREAVSFLVRVKECVEDPQRILIET
jgi:2-oxoglutarate dehydrogenase E2 component (dihydrolipoamide succinyltransferase)